MRLFDANSLVENLESKERTECVISETESSDFHSSQLLSVEYTHNFWVHNASSVAAGSSSCTAISSSFESSVLDSLGSDSDSACSRQR